MRESDALILAAIRGVQADSLEQAQQEGFGELEAGRARARHRQNIYELDQLVEKFLAFMRGQSGVRPEQFLPKEPARRPLFGGGRGSKALPGWRLIQTAQVSRAFVRPVRGAWYGVTTDGEWVSGISYPDGWHPDQAGPNEEQYNYPDRPWLHYFEAAPGGVFDLRESSYLSLYDSWQTGNVLQAAARTIGQICGRNGLTWPLETPSESASGPDPAGS